eukprot:1072681-Rhodomonas_salina.2
MATAAADAPRAMLMALSQQTAACTRDADGAQPTDSRLHSRCSTHAPASPLHTPHPALPSRLLALICSDLL